MKQLSILLLVLVGLSSCKLPEVPKINIKICKTQKAVLKINRDYTDISNYYFSLDSVEGNTKNITWKLNDKVFQDLPQNKNFNYKFEADGNYIITVEVKDSCNNSLKITKELALKTDVYVKPINRFVNNDGTEADIQGFSFDNNGNFNAYIMWNKNPRFIPDGGITLNFKDCESPIDGINGNIGKINAYRFKSDTKQNFIIETRGRDCNINGPSIGDYVFRIGPSLKTYGKLGGRYSFELGKNNLFIRGKSNIALVPYSNLDINYELLNAKDTIKYNFNSWNFMFGKYNDNEYLAVITQYNKYSFVKFFEDTRQGSEIFSFKIFDNGLDGLNSVSTVGIGTLRDFCIDANGEIWILEIKRSPNTAVGFGSQKDEFRIRKISKNGQILTMVDNNTPQIAGLVSGPFVDFKNPKNIAFNSNENSIYFTDGGSYKKIVLK